MRIIGNKLLVEPVAPPTKTASGLLLADPYNKDTMTFKVLAVGNGRKLKNGTVIPIDIQPGDQVIAPLYHDHTTLDCGHKIIDASQVIALIPSQSPA